MSPFAESSLALVGAAPHLPTFRHRPPPDGQIQSEEVISPSSRPRILSIGDDRHLLESRHLLLTSLGFNVVSIPSSASLEAAVLQSFDVVIVCHTLMRSRQQMVHFIRTVCPHLPVLVLSRVFWGNDPDNLRGISPTPQGLLAAIARVLNSGNDDMK